MDFNLKDLSQNQRYHLLTQTIVPRPIAWVLSENQDNASYNLAPFSFFNAVSAKPAIVMLGFTTKSDGSQKDTWRNIIDRSHCTIHLASYEQLDQLVGTSAELAYGTSEVEVNNLQLEEFAQHTLPRITGAPVALGCKLHSFQSFTEDERSGMILFEVERVYIDSNICNTTDGRIHVDASKYSPPARLGGASYATMYKLEDKQRP